MDRSDYGDRVSLQIKYDFKDTDSIGNMYVCMYVCTVCCTSMHLYVLIVQYQES